MQTMETVSIEDVYPLESGDVPMNPRAFGSADVEAYIAELGEQFKGNRLNPGQPRIRPILYRDGGIYRIVDGECRIRAMRAIGTREFAAEVYDDLDDAELARREAAKAMVETDVKRQLTAEEMSRGVQTMLALDVPDEEVAASARLDVAAVRRARRGARKVDDAAYDMTLDRLMAIADFEDDPEAVAALRDCSQSEWKRVLSDLQSQRRERETMEKMLAMCEERGADVLDECPEGCTVSLRFAACYGDWALKNLEGWLDRNQGAPVVCKDGSLNGCIAVDGAADEAKRAEAEERAAFIEDQGAAARARARWIGEHAADPASMKRTAAFLAGLAESSFSVENFAEETGFSIPVEPSPLACAVGFRAAGTVNPAILFRILRGEAVAYVNASAVSANLGLMEAMEKDGYPIGDADRDAMEACRMAMDINEDEEER